MYKNERNVEIAVDWFCCFIQQAQYNDCMRIIRDLHVCFVVEIRLRLWTDLWYIFVIIILKINDYLGQQRTIRLFGNISSTFYFEYYLM